MAYKNQMNFKSPTPIRCRFRSLCMGLLASLVTIHAFAQNDTSLPAIPDYYQEPGLSRNKNYETQAAHEAIDTFSGRLQYHFTDLFIPGNGGLDIAVQRSYNAIDDPDPMQGTGQPWPAEFSPAGLGWTMHFGRIIRGQQIDICSNNWAVSSKNPVLEMPDGQRRVLYEYEQIVPPQSKPTKWITKDFWRASCNTNSGALGFNVESPDGTRYEMTTIGHLFTVGGSLMKTYYTTRIVDRNGNTMNLSYTTVNGVTAVSGITTSDGRSVSFSYNSSGIQSVTAGSRTWNYSMVSGAGGQNYLSQVTRPDGLSWKFNYRSSSPGTGSMSKVEYPGGGTIDYTYDHVYFRVGVANAKPSTVIKTKVSTPGGGSTDPAGTWNYSYVPATETLPFRNNGDGTLTYQYAVPPVGTASIVGGSFSPTQLDITTVEGPEPGRTVKHYHLGARSVNFTTTSGRAIGRYAGYEAPEEVVTYYYHDFHISGQKDVTNSLHGVPESATYAGVQDFEYRRRGITPSGTYESYVIEKPSFDAWGNPKAIQERGFGGYTGTHIRSRALTYGDYTIDSNKWFIRQVTGETTTVTVDNVAESHAITRTFDPNNGNLLSETVAGVPTTFNYFPTGDLQSRTNAINQTTSYSNYKRGIAQGESQPGGVALARVVDDFGNVTSATNGRNFTTTYTYDGLNRVTGVTPPVGNPVTVGYTGLSRSVSRGGMVNLQSFDGIGRLKRQEVSAPTEIAIAVDYRYDSRGRRVFQSYPNSSSGLTFTYDDLDRVVETAYPTLDGLSYSVFNTYFGMRTAIHDSSERATFLYHRGFGNPNELQVMKVFQGYSPDGVNMSTTYKALFQRNVLGQITSVVKGSASDGTGGWTRSYGYNSNFYQTSQTDPEVGTTIFGRDLLGNMLSKKIGAQPIITYGLDPRNRVSSITYSASEDPLVPQAPNVTYTYYNTDVVQSVTSGGVVRSYVYDGADKVTSETLVAEAGRSYTVAYDYNANEALSSVTYPSGHVVSHSPDGYGRPAAVAPYVTDVDYHSNGMPQQITYANGVTSTMGLNERLWPSSLNVNRTGGNVVQNAYSYDLSGNLTEISDSLDSAYSRSYQYDYINRLTRDVSGSGNYLYDYDNVGNIKAVYYSLWVNGVPLSSVYKSYSYDTGTASSTGRLLSFEGPGNFQFFSYDLSGNVRSDDTGKTYGYDRANNMRCVNCGGAAQVAHTYDGTNMRVKTSEGGVNTFSFYDHRGLLLQTEKPGVERKEYMYLGRRQVAERKVPLN